MLKMITKYLSSISGFTILDLLLTYLASIPLPVYNLVWFFYAMHLSTVQTSTLV